MRPFVLEVVGEMLKVDCFTLDLSSAQALLVAARDALKGGSIKRVVVLTGNVSDIAEAVKKELVPVQRELSNGRRTAWVDERARFRGIALWVMHLAQDPNGKALSTMAQAEDWLQSTEAREARGSRVAGP
ncbi:MAG: hypothetical protein JNM17_30815 [Archangium sp.]|nr:hypothetical protein [Archangium sp.]